MLTTRPMGILVRLLGALAVVAMVAVATGCADEATLPEYYYHPEGWLSASSADFHGAAVLSSATKAESCQTCHGQDYLGGTSEVACTSCHAAYPHEAAFGGEPRAVHASYMRDVANWDLSTCTTCHGESYDGDGVADKSCLTCHTEDEGPEACNTCHGADGTGVPPPDLYGGTATSNRGVGAHAVHAALGSGTDACLVCHNVPDSYSASGHIDDDQAQAEVVFSGIAVHAGSEASYDAVAGTCGSTYCHGGFAFAKADAPAGNAFGYAADVIEGNAPVMTWTDVGSGAAVCGTCHGLPPTGHGPFTACNTCHSSFPDNHADGMINVFGSSR